MLNVGSILSGTDANSIRNLWNRRLESLGYPHSILVEMFSLHYDTIVALSFPWES
jgi:hypothetical protein